VKIIEPLKHALPRYGRNDVADNLIVIEHRDCLNLRSLESSSGILLEIADAHGEVGFDPLENAIHVRLRI